MDVTQLVSILTAALLPSGGVAALFMIRGRRKELEISNLSAVIAKWQEIAEDRKNRAAELKADLDRKDGKIDALYATISEMRDTLDHTRTSLATAEMLICDKTKCTTRTPPFGSGRTYMQHLQELHPDFTKCDN